MTSDAEQFAAMATRASEHFESLSPDEQRAYRRELSITLLCALYRVGGRSVERAVVSEWLDANAGGPWG